MAYFLSIYRSNGTTALGAGLNGNNRIDLYTAAGVATEVVNSPDVAPASGGKFPVYLSDATTVVLIPYTSATTGTIISDTISGETPGDARTTYRAAPITDGEAMVIRARLTNEFGEAYGYQAFTGVTVAVYDVSTGSADVYTSSDPAPAIVFETALMPWPDDDFGYSLAYTVLPSELTGGTEGGHVYRVELVCALNTGGAKTVTQFFRVQSVMSA